MMARVAIEECWWSDPRRTELLMKIGFETDSAAVNMWRTAQEFWGNGRKLVPKKIFDRLKYSDEILEVGLAELRENEVYICGSSDFLDWIHEKREQAKEAGKKGGKLSAQRPRNEKGQLLSKNYPSETQAKPKRNPSGTQAKPSETKPSGSDSDSGSGLNKKKGESKKTAQSIKQEQEIRTYSTDLATLLWVNLGKFKHDEARAISEFGKSENHVKFLIRRLGGWKELRYAFQDKEITRQSSISQWRDILINHISNSS